MTQSPANFNTNISQHWKSMDAGRRPPNVQNVSREIFVKSFTDKVLCDFTLLSVPWYTIGKMFSCVWSSGYRFLTLTNHSTSQKTWCQTHASELGWRWPSGLAGCIFSPEVAHIVSWSLTGTQILWTPKNAHYKFGNRKGKGGGLLSLLFFFFLLVCITWDKYYTNRFSKIGSRELKYTQKLRDEGTEIQDSRSKIQFICFHLKIWIEIQNKAWFKNNWDENATENAKCVANGTQRFKITYKNRYKYYT